MLNPRQSVLVRRLFVLLLTLLVMAWPSLALAAGSVVVKPTSVVAGQSVTVTGSGWAPYDRIIVSFVDSSGTRLPLGVISADTTGSFQQTVAVPATVPPGSYKIDGIGLGGSVTVKLTVLAPNTAPPPTSTPAPSPPPTATVRPTTVPSPVPPTPTPLATRTPTSTPPPMPTIAPTQTTSPSLPERVDRAGLDLRLVGLLALIPIALVTGYLFSRRRGE